jgi:hypothetical protein
MGNNVQSAKPSVDLNQAVENTALVAAMERVARENSDSAKDILLHELQRANYLAAMFTEGMKAHEQSPGVKVLPKGSKFGVLAAGKDGKNFLVLFTDWSALRAYTSRNVTGWALPAKDAWLFALQGTTYDGVVINPAHNALPLARPMLEYLSKSAKP